MWVDRMQIECCGRLYVPTVPSQAVLYMLLLLTVIPAFYVDIHIYELLLFGWAAVLCFAAPVFQKFKPKRVADIHDGFIRRVIANTLWHPPMVFIVFALGADIIGYRKLPYEDFMKIVAFTSIALAAITLISLAVSVVRVLLESRKIRRGK